jgi:hypothetical protein
MAATAGSDNDLHTCPRCCGWCYVSTNVSGHPNAVKLSPHKDWRDGQPCEGSNLVLYT